MRHPLAAERSRPVLPGLADGPAGVTVWSRRTDARYDEASLGFDHIDTDARGVAIRPCALAPVYTIAPGHPDARSEIARRRHRRAGLPDVDVFGSPGNPGAPMNSSVPITASAPAIARRRSDHRMVLADALADLFAVRDHRAVLLPALSQPPRPWAVHQERIVRGRPGASPAAPRASGSRAAVPRRSESACGIIARADRRPPARARSTARAPGS
jgi:hypothetical protein